MKLRKVINQFDQSVLIDAEKINYIVPIDNSNNEILSEIHFNNRMIIVSHSLCELISIMNSESNIYG